MKEEEKTEKDQDKLASLETVKTLVNCLKALRSWTECVESSYSHPVPTSPGDFAEQKPSRPTIKVCLKFPRCHQAIVFKSAAKSQQPPSCPSRSTFFKPPLTTPFNGCLQRQHRPCLIFRVTRNFLRGSATFFHGPIRRNTADHPVALVTLRVFCILVG